MSAEQLPITIMSLVWFISRRYCSWPAASWPHECTENGEVLRWSKPGSVLPPWPGSRVQPGVRAWSSAALTWEHFARHSLTLNWTVRTLCGTNADKPPSRKKTIPYVFDAITPTHCARELQQHACTTHLHFQIFTGNTFRQFVDAIPKRHTGTKLINNGNYFSRHLIDESRTRIFHSQAAERTTVSAQFWDRLWNKQRDAPSTNTSFLCLVHLLLWVMTFDDCLLSFAFNISQLSLGKCDETVSQSLATAADAKGKITGTDNGDPCQKCVSTVFVFVCLFLVANIFCYILEWVKRDKKL